MNKWPTRVLHLGLGRFHRAHQAVYFQNLAEQTGEQWGIASFSMRSSEASDQMRAVENRYPVVQFSKYDQKIQWIDAIRESNFAVRDQTRLLELFKEVDLITLTVTEKAYQTSELISLVFNGLKHRSQTSKKHLTILSCDNLLSNGEKLEQSILKFSHVQGDSNITIWIRENVSFPNTMVDRIVPSLTPTRLIELQKLVGSENPELVATESFSQWVIEDNFKGPKPPLEKVGVQFVKDVKPYEEMKLRLLNASHSALAYFGLQKGHSFVHEAIRDPAILADVRSLQKEVAQVLHLPQGFSVQDYCNALLERFDNERLPHQLKQIAMDGSQKLRQRIFPTLEAALKQNKQVPHVNKVLEAWIRYCFENSPDDPLREKIALIKSQEKDFESFRSKLLKVAFA